MTIYTLGKDSTSQEARIDMSADDCGDLIWLDLNGDTDTTRLVFSRDEAILVLARLSNALVNK